jgi:hypothetical protein
MILKIFCQWFDLETTTHERGQCTGVLVDFSKCNRAADGVQFQKG